MPIRIEFRKYYGREWRALRRVVLQRDSYRCRQCHRNLGLETWASVTRILGERRMWWRRWSPLLKEPYGEWRDSRGRLAPPGPLGWCVTPAHVVHVRLDVAHLDGNPANRDDRNLASLCAWCHRNTDLAAVRESSAETRKHNKDWARPLLAHEARHWELLRGQCREAIAVVGGGCLAVERNA